MPADDLQRACALIEEALALCDAGGESLAAARLQWALDTLSRSKSAHAVGDLEAL